MISRRMHSTSGQHSHCKRSQPLLDPWAWWQSHVFWACLKAGLVGANLGSQGVMFHRVGTMAEKAFFLGPTR